MATKFITIRIPIPRINRIVEEEQSYVASDDFAVRLFEIQSRIAALKSSLGWTKKSNKDIEIRSKPVVVQEKQLSDTAAREAELNDLKAKLLGKKL